MRHASTSRPSGKRNAARGFGPSSRPNPLNPTEGDRVLARSGPAGYAFVRSRGRWRPAPHLTIIDRLVADVARSIERGEPRRVMVFMPPRHGKSELISRHVPAWFLGTHPDRRVILASYGATLAFRLSRQARDDMLDVGPALFGVHVDPDVAARDRWALLGQGDPDNAEEYREGGGMLAAGVGGGITGEGADLFVIDDPVKDQEEAASELIQERNIEWWRSTARTRLMPGGAVIVLQTRWHEADLAGMLLQDARDGTGDEWEVLCLPALAEEDHELQPDGDELDRQPGEALWTAQYDEQALAATARAVGSYWWAALYQQRPMPAGGLVFRRDDFRYYTVEQVPGADGVQLGYRLHQGEGRPDKVYTRDHTAEFVTVDSALSEKETADYSVIQRWAVTTGRDLILLDQVRERFEHPNLADLIERTWRAWGRPLVKIESKAAGTALVQLLRRRGVPVSELEADTDKVTRARGAAPLWEAHQVYHPTAAPWLDEFERELLGFPNARHDDQVDAAVYAALSAHSLTPGVKRRGQEQRRPLTAGVRTAQM